MENSALTAGSVVDMNIDEVIVVDRFRNVFPQGDEDLKSLEASIKENGLFHPITVNQDYKLLAGHRRLISCKNLGHTTINAKIVNTENEQHDRLIEVLENTNRQNFKFSELMNIADYFEPYIEARSKERKSTKTGTDLLIPGLPAMKGKTSEIMVKILNLKGGVIGSATTYERARSVWQAEESDMKTTIISELDEAKVSIAAAAERLRHGKSTAAEVAADNTKANEQDVQSDGKGPVENGIDELGQGQTTTPVPAAAAGESGSISLRSVISSLKDLETFKRFESVQDFEPEELENLDDFIEILESLTEKVKALKRQAQQ